MTELRLFPLSCICEEIVEVCLPTVWINVRCPASRNKLGSQMRIIIDVHVLIVLAVKLIIVVL